jgi:hypothetical protein
MELEILEKTMTGIEFKTKYPDLCIKFVDNSDKYQPGYSECKMSFTTMQFFVTWFKNFGEYLYIIQIPDNAKITQHYLYYSTDKVILSDRIPIKNFIQKNWDLFSDYDLGYLNDFIKNYVYDPTENRMKIKSRESFFF